MWAPGSSGDGDCAAARAVEIGAVDRGRQLGLDGDDLGLDAVLERATSRGRARAPRPRSGAAASRPPLVPRFPQQRVEAIDQGDDAGPERDIVAAEAGGVAARRPSSS